MSELTVKKVLEGRPLGHPIHPLISHIPLGMWLFALGLDIYSMAANDDANWAVRGAYYALLIGTAVALLTVLTGFNDWFSVRDDHPGQRMVILHLLLMVPATLLFVLDTVLHYRVIDAPQVSGLQLAFSISGYVLALVGGYVGGLLVYDEGIAVGRHRRAAELPAHTLTEPTSAHEDDGYSPIVPDSALAEGATLRAEVHGTVVTLARADGKVYAVQEFCTHRCGQLSEGTLHGGEIQCPWHNSCFDLGTGQPTHGPAKVPLKTFDARVCNGIVEVRVSRGDEGRPPERRNPPETAPARDGGRRNPMENPANSRGPKAPGGAGEPPVS
jgi:nitrite reductase/ring-hydroxylating ferredoxin subunit/uncharacterized membrane protein